ncbi:MAG: NAD(P)H-hydrate dehydratase [Chloroflexi bacterium]|nr:NAD(P)H-hydrate dehydratase [Chloroflexota bacterium]
MKVSMVNEMRAMDRAAIDRYGISEELLMENAGQAAYFVLLREMGIAGRRFIVFCGSGNNGGDGLVVARKILSSGGCVKVVLLGDPTGYAGASRTNYEILSRLPIDVDQVQSVTDVRDDVARSDAIVDAIFGTGLARGVEGRYRDIIELINESGKPVLSIDIPSGVNGDTGQVMGCAVRATCTVTFGLPKLGNLLFPGCELCGRLHVSHISFPPELYDADSLSVEISPVLPLPVRARDGHKGTFGDALFVAGAAGYYGAPYFAALSFMKAGGGYSRLATPAAVMPYLAAGGSEIVFVPQPGTAVGSLALEGKEALLELADRVDVVVLGPGISLHEETQQLVRGLVREVHKPLLIDGDGITAICSDLDGVATRMAPTILTPHLGEMARMTGLSVAEISADRVGVLRRTAMRLRSTVVLKGAHSQICTPDGRVWINMSGNPGMATAGSGDVLCGTIAAMYGLGFAIEVAARQGVFVHGFAGDLAAGAKGEDGITAADIMDFLPPAMKQLREAPVQLRDRYAGVELI